MVGSGNPPHRHPPRKKKHPARSHHRLVALAKSPSSSRSTSPHQTEIATVMLTPTSTPVQAKRPFKWVAWDAARLMDMLRGSYLFEDDPKRILQDPESMRASYIR
jgi:histidine ammonia-lyase